MIINSMAKEETELRKPKYHGAESVYSGHLL